MPELPAMLAILHSHQRDTRCEQELPAVTAILHSQKCDTRCEQELLAAVTTIFFAYKCDVVLALHIREQQFLL